MSSADLKFTKDHEWIKLTGGDANEPVDVGDPFEVALQGAVEAALEDLVGAVLQGEPDST